MDELRTWRRGGVTRTAAGTCRRRHAQTAPRADSRDRLSLRWASPSGPSALGALPMGHGPRTPHRRRSRRAPGAVTLVGYTTPREAYEEIIPLFQATEAGAGVAVREVVSARPATRAAPSRPACPRTSWRCRCGRTSSGSSSRASWPRTGTTTSTRASSQQRRRLRRPPRQPQEHPDAGTTSSATTSSVITPNPFTSGGAQWNILAAYQAQIDAGKTEEEAIDYLRQLSPARRRLGPQRARRAATVPAPARATCSSPTRTRPSSRSSRASRSSYVVPDTTLLIENPVAVTLNGDAPEPAKAFVDFLYTPEAQTIFGQHGLPAGGRRGRCPVPDFPQPANLVTVAGPRRLGGGPPRFFDPDTGIMAEIFAELGLERAEQRHQRRPPSRRAPASRRTTAGASWAPASPRSTWASSSSSRSRPSSGSRSPTAWTSSSTAITSPQALAALQLTFVPSAIVVAHQRRHRHAHRVGPRCATTSPARPSSTRSSTCPSRCRPSSPA